MFAKGTSWRKKVIATAGMYFLFLALGFFYASRLFHEGQLATVAGWMLAAIMGPVLVWFLYKKNADPAFAAQVEQRKANPSPQAMTAKNTVPLLMVAFHLIFLVCVLACKRGLDQLEPQWPRIDVIAVATMAATAVAGFVVMTVVVIQEKRSAGVPA